MGYKTRRTASLVLLGGIILAAFSMRAPITSVGPVVGLIRDDLGLSGMAAGMITTLPLLAFAVFSPFVPRLSELFGIKRVLLLAMLGIAAGVAFRYLYGSYGLFAGTLLVGLAIGACNVVLPGLIKAEFPSRIGTVIGIYTTSMSSFAAIASGLAVPVAVGLGMGWQGALGIWIIPAAAASVLWLVIAKDKGHMPKRHKHDRPEAVNMLKSALAWQISLFMGVQSLLFYSLVAWLPNIIEHQGFTPSQAGWLLSVMQVASLPFGFVAPIIAARRTGQLPIVIAGTLCFVLGFIGLIFELTGYILVWVSLVGIAGGVNFSLAMMFLSLRTANVHDAARLSGMAQAVGYTLAAAGPSFFGYIFDITGSWDYPLELLLFFSVVLFMLGAGCSRRMVIGR